MRGERAGALVNGKEFEVELAAPPSPAPSSSIVAECRVRPMAAAAVAVTSVGVVAGPEEVATASEEEPAPEEHAPELAASRA